MKILRSTRAYLLPVRQLGEISLGNWCIFPDFRVQRKFCQSDLSNWSWAQELPGGILEDLLPHPFTVARALADQEFQLVHKYVFTSDRLPFHLHDEMRLLLTGDGGLTVHLTVSLSAHPADFIMTITGTRSTLRIDLRKTIPAVARSSRPECICKGGTGQRGGPS
jgi:predicted dehydrogenase